MTFTLRYHPDVRDVELPLINKNIKQRIKKGIEERLVIAPEKYSDPLRKTLKGYRKMRIGDYRVLLKVIGAQICILGIRHRKDAYQKIAGRV
ncbi:MAG: type II toxin-antitoxin system RelE/ParE family toxin [Desulfobacterales bacterium]|jgi:mRNA interferase RelE/StbE|nr:type II toxin-antitoxin system RelE/ParE family toxin [Desulfobacterales bacterium]